MLLHIAIIVSLHSGIFSYDAKLCKHADRKTNILQQAQLTELSKNIKIQAHIFQKSFILNGSICEKHNCSVYFQETKQINNDEWYFLNKVIQPINIVSNL